MTTIVTLRPEDDAYIRDEGSIVVLKGRDPSGAMLTIGVDPRTADDVLAALILRDEEVEVEVEHWQILGKKVPENH